MNRNLPLPQLEQFTSHAIASLPDSLVARKAILATLLDLLPRRSDLTSIRQQISSMLLSLEEHESAQLKFSILS